MAETLAQKVDRCRREDVEIAKLVLADPQSFGIQVRWARLVIENEQKAVAKAAEK